MTRIEERLRDALQASAARVRDDRLRPLPAREPDPGAERKVRRRLVWRAWLIPVAAAASVVLVIGLVLAVTRHATPTQQQPASQQAPLPGYFVRIAPGGGTPPIEVQSVSTGAVIATVRSPKPPRGGALNVGAVAAAPDDRTFYVEYGLVSPNINVTQTWILTFSITGSGSATPLTTVKGGLLSHQPPDLQTWGSLAVSPDGSKLALTVDSSDHISNTSPGYSDKIIVIDLHTGQRTQWQGGLYRPGKQFSIPDLSWAADGRSLVFLGQWCDPAGQGTTCDGTSGPGGYRDAQVRSLSTATGGGSLNHGRLLLGESARYPLIAQALGGYPDATAATCSGLDRRGIDRDREEHLAIGHDDVGERAGPRQGLALRRGHRFEPREDLALRQRHLISPGARGRRAWWQAIHQITMPLGRSTEPLPRCR